MAVAGHPYKEEPLNYIGRNVYEATCFGIIDRLYEKMEKTYEQLLTEDRNSCVMRKVRVELAREMAYNDPDLKKLWFDKNEE